MATFAFSMVHNATDSPLHKHVHSVAQQQQQQQQQQQYQLSTKNGQPISDSTQWDDINDPSKQVLLGLE